MYATCFSTFIRYVFLYSLEADLKQWLLTKNEKKLARSINFTFHSIDDVLLLNNHKFGDFVDRIYPIELDITDTTDTAIYASYLDLLLEIENNSRLRTKHYDKRYDCNITIVNFPFICSNIPAAPAYGVDIDQSVCYSRASYHDLFDSLLLLTGKLLN